MNVKRFIRKHYKMLKNINKTLTYRYSNEEVERVCYYGLYKIK
ncbi:hypothetical protein BCD72_001437 [Clostridium butyricum]|nr:hypothetical protein SC08_Contig83orf01802 [Clostridium butyricum]MBA8967701.1 hypothetical protein [Clostridium butyricum]MBA8971231.1 hypothetical protein [Clostridium butyricum]NOW36902.1 hypothetical protein [Clostridium butyricum]